MVAEIDPLLMTDSWFRRYILAELKELKDWINTLDFKTNKNPQAVKPTGDNQSLRNLADRESQCTRCFPGKPGKELIDCDGSAGFRPCTGCTT